MLPGVGEEEGAEVEAESRGGGEVLPGEVGGGPAQGQGGAAAGRGAHCTLHRLAEGGVKIVSPMF